MALVPIAAAVLVAYGIITWVVNLRYYIKEAKRSGLPYVVTRASTSSTPVQRVNTARNPCSAKAN
jgi:hypothetical protein